MFSRILVPLDGSEMAEGIVPYVTQLADRLPAGVVLLTVVDPDPHPVEATDAPPHETRPEQPDPSRPAASGRAEDAIRADTTVGEPESDLLRDSQAYVNQIGGRLADRGIEVECVATAGRPADRILETAEAEACDLIAMATHGRNFVVRGLLGSVTDRVAHRSTIPVLTISPTRGQGLPSGEDQIRNLIVPLDGSDLAETALYAVEVLAEAMSVQVHLVHAFDPTEYDRRHRYSLALAGQGSARERLRANHNSYLDSVADGLRSKGLDVHTEVLEGPTVRTLVEYGRSTPQSFVAMSTHGRTGFRRLLLGSVTEGVVRSSSAPVLIVPPHAGSHVSTED